MTEGRKVAAIFVADVVGYSRLAAAEEEFTLARLRALRSDLIDPTIAIHNGRVVKRTGDGAIVEFRSVVEAVRCAMEVQSGIAERNAGLPADKRIDIRIGVHLGDVVEEADGDLMGDGVNIAARLQAICEPGGICLSEDAYRQVKSRLELRVADLGLRSLKNIAEPVRVYLLRQGAAVASVAKPRVGAVRWAAIAAALVAALFAAGWFSWQKFRPSLAPVPPQVSAVADEKLAHAPRLSLVVLPFANLSGDPEQDYFADGVTNDLTTDLSHLADSFVIAHNTALTYKGKAIDPREVGRQLGVRYALEGSVQRVGETVTVNAQLISTETGAHIWADRFAGERIKLGELQVEVVSRIANTLAVQLVHAESLHAIREGPASAGAVDFAMRGTAAMDEGMTPANLNKAIGYFDQALSSDPDCTSALIGKAVAQITNLYAYGTGDWMKVPSDVEQTMNRILSSQPHNAEALFMKGVALKGEKQFDAALANYDAAIRIDPNNARAYAEKGEILILSGRAEEAFEPVEKALRLDPLGRGREFSEWFMCDAYAHLARWEKAIPWCQRSAASNPALFWPYFNLSAANAWLGRTAEARAAVAELQMLKPGVTVQEYLRLLDLPNPKFMSGRDRIAEGLRKAGLPET